MKKKILFIYLLISIFAISFAQGTSGSNAKFEYRSLVDIPSAGILEKGYVGVTMDVLPFGVVMSRIEAGVFDNFSFGISYGGANIIGTGEIEWYNMPGINARVRLMDETEKYPALTLGFDSQGKGAYNEKVDRFEIKSPGFFLAAAKNFEFLGYLSLHGTVNYSLEREDNDKDLNLSVGMEKTIGSKISFVAEYDFAVNDNGVKSFGAGNGYLNMGVRWSVGEGFTIGMDLRDMLANQKLNSYKADRAIFVEYVISIK